MFKERKNLRKVAAIAACLAVTTMFAQETGVVINGVTWATRNVGAPGNFAAAPENSGMFYQWNSKIGWSSTDPLVSTNGSTWNSAWDGNGATTWETANDPSPVGWRVPTKAEMGSLLNTTYVTRVWTTQSGTNGFLFTDNATGNSIFFPAAGDRFYTDASLERVGTNGYYWIDTDNGNEYVYGLNFGNSGNAVLNGLLKSLGCSFRPVKIGSTGINDVSADTENAKITGYFDILGRKLTEEPTKGLYIIQYDNGKTKKMIK